MLGNFFICLGQTAGALGFSIYPDISVPQMLSMRAFFALAILTVMLKGNFKKVMIDELKGKPQIRMALAVRICLNMFTLSVNYASLKYFSITIVALFSNLTPLCTTVLAAVLLKEPVTKSNLLMLAIAFSAIQCMIWGAPQDAPGSDASWWQWVLLCFNPIAGSFA